VEKNRVGPGVAEVAKKLDGCDVKHEIVALILTGIRGSRGKRRIRVEGRVVESKWVPKWEE
jgi:hypothetical protein